MLNLGILAHVDAGKTSLTERLLYHAGVIPAVGSVDAGSTQTDSLALERQRGITIRSAVVSFTIGDVAVNLIDTPGHPDFIAEVERVLAVLDGAVLVISAVEGIQAQTRVLMRTLRRLGLPTLLFVNKIDRGDARYGPLLAQLASRLTPAVVAMGGVSGLGSRTADFTPFGAGDGGFTGQLALTLAIAKQPELLVLDEPAASLDPLARRELLRNLMEAVAAQGTSVLLSSHLVADLERVCDYLVVLVASQVRLAGDVGALLESHHRLSGPRRDAATLPGDQEVIEESHIGKQSTFLVRSSGPVHDPAWTVRPVSLEDLVLAYLGRAAAPGQAQQPGLAVVS